MCFPNIRQCYHYDPRGFHLDVGSSTQISAQLHGCNNVRQGVYGVYANSSIAEFSFNESTLNFVGDLFLLEPFHLQWWNSHKRWESRVVIQGDINVDAWYIKASEPLIVGLLPK
jgi:hypothetical protein